MRRCRGFTLIEIMGVVFIIGLLAILAIPSMIKARQISRQNICINNLRQIDSAKERWAIENGATTGDLVQPGWVNYTKKQMMPVCPADGTYSIGAVSAIPTCNITGHALEY